MATNPMEPTPKPDVPPPSRPQETPPQRPQEVPDNLPGRTDEPAANPRASARPGM